MRTHSRAHASRGAGPGNACYPACKAAWARVHMWQERLGDEEGGRGVRGKGGGRVHECRGGDNQQRTHTSSAAVHRQMASMSVLGQHSGPSRKRGRPKQRRRQKRGERGREEAQEFRPRTSSAVVYRHMASMSQQHARPLERAVGALFLLLHVAVQPVLRLAACVQQPPAVARPHSRLLIPIARQAAERAAAAVAALRRAADERYATGGADVEASRQPRAVRALGPVLAGHAAGCPSVG
eukprot:359702-Chlamydomonas_euryale.AAC.7